MQIEKRKIDFKSRATAEYILLKRPTQQVFKSEKNSRLIYDLVNKGNDIV